MSNVIVVWDIETVPDLRGYAAANGMSAATDGIGALVAHREYITRKDGLPLTFAGLWEKRKDGMLSFTILRTEAYDDGMRDLHTRTPVIVDANGVEAWLAGEPPSPAPGLDTAVHFFPVSPKVNKPAYNQPDCIEPLVG